MRRYVIEIEGDNEFLHRKALEAGVPVIEREGKTSVRSVALAEPESNGACAHRWASGMGASGQDGVTYPASSGTGTRLFQVCRHCGEVRQVSS